MDSSVCSFLFFLAFDLQICTRFLGPLLRRLQNGIPLLISESGGFKSCSTAPNGRNSCQNSSKYGPTAPSIQKHSEVF